MDAVKFIKELHRMCASHTSCYYDKCPIDVEGMNCDFETMANNAEKVVSLVEQWSKKQSIKTNRDMFEKVFSTELELIREEDTGNYYIGLPIEWWDKKYAEGADDKEV